MAAQHPIAHTFTTESTDHCETPVTAYAEIAPVRLPLRCPRLFKPSFFHHLTPHPHRRSDGHPRSSRNPQMECSLNGDCVQGRCVCDPGWTGSGCDVLALLPEPTAGALGYHNRSFSSWGGNVVEVNVSCDLYTHTRTHSTQTTVCYYPW